LRNHAPDVLIPRRAAADAVPLRAYRQSLGRGKPQTQVNTLEDLCVTAGKTSPRAWFSFAAGTPADGRALTTWFAPPSVQKKVRRAASRPPSTHKPVEVAVRDAMTSPTLPLRLQTVPHPC
jgi:hypothetical protein